MESENSLLAADCSKKWRMRIEFRPFDIEFEVESENFHAALVQAFDIKL